MSNTQYKGYNVQSTGTNSGTWGDILNAQVIGIIDANMGGIVSKTPAGSNITLTTDEAKCALISLSGSGPSTNIQVISSNQGFYFVENLCTGNFTITITNGVAGVVVPRGMRVTIFADSTNGCRIVGNLGFVSGTSQTFLNASAPTGWTKSTSLDNGTIRIVSGTGGGTGGTANFTSAFAARTILQANLPNVSFTVTDPGHTHVFSSNGTRTGSNNTNPNGNFWASSGDSGAQYGPISKATASGTTGISVSSGGSGTAMDFAVKYADAVVGVVN